MKSVSTKKKIYFYCKEKLFSVLNVYLKYFIFNLNKYLLDFKENMHYFYYFKGSTGGDTTHRTTFALTVKALFINVSNSTEGQDFDFSTGLNKYVVTPRKYLPTETDLFKNDFFVQVVQVVVSLIGVFVFVFTIFTITYIYFKCFRKTSNEGEMKEKQLKAQYDSLSFGADDPESRIQPEQEEQVGTECTYLTPVFRRSDNCDTCCSDEMVEIFKETTDCSLNRQKNRHTSANESNVISDAEPINIYIENTQDKIEDLNLDGACQVE